jgi:DNA-binding transcriptional MerR regulator
MPDNDTPVYTIAELADLAGVTPRTIRYYLAQGLLPSAGQTGPGTRYSESHLARLRVIRNLQTEHLPLAEIRRRLADLDDDQIVALAGQDEPPPPSDSALDYVRSLLRETPAPYGQPLRQARASMAMPAFDQVTFEPAAMASAPPSIPAPTSAERLGESHHSTAKPGERSQWERIVLATDVELHIRRPLGRTQNKRVDRLVTIARELLEEDPQ